MDWQPGAIARAMPPGASTPGTSAHRFSPAPDTVNPLPDAYAPFVLTGRIAQRVLRLPVEVGAAHAGAAHAEAAHVGAVHAGAPGVAPAPAAQRRHAEYQAGRDLAATLLAGLGAQTLQVGTNADRAPVWPDGFTGSISHSRQLLAVAVGRHEDTRGLGIDLEAIANADELQAIESVCMVPEEHALVGNALPRADWATLVFSAKEAFYKCQFPLTRCPLEFGDLAVMHADVSAQRLVLRLQRDAGPDFRRGQSFHCGYRYGQGHVYTAVQLAP